MLELSPSAPARLSLLSNDSHLASTRRSHGSAFDLRPTTRSRRTLSIMRHATKVMIADKTMQDRPPRLQVHQALVGAEYAVKPRVKQDDHEHRQAPEKFNTV